MNPSGWQELPQKPLLQAWLQQSLSTAHAAPWGLHWVMPQKPSVAQIWSQHSPGVVQAAPSGLHMIPPQKPLAHAFPPQHTLAELHADPIAALIKVFPGLGADSGALQKWWTLSVARFSAADRFRGLSARAGDCAGDKGQRQQGAYR